MPLTKKIADADFETTMFSQPFNRTLSQYVKKLYEEILQFGGLYGEHDLSESLQEAFHRFISPNLRGCWASRKSEILNDLSYYEMLLLK